MELAQCANPHVRNDEILSQLLRCPAPPVQVPQNTTSQVPVRVVDSVGRQQPSVLGGSATSTGFGGFAFTGRQSVPPLPNYGFSGDGPHGMSPGGAAMPAFAPSQEISIPVPFR